MNSGLAEELEKAWGPQHGSWRFPQVRSEWDAQEMAMKLICSSSCLLLK